MKAKHIIGAIVIAICIGVGVFSLRSSLTPYVSFKEAMDSRRTVQLAGSLVAGTTAFDKSTGEYRFKLTDTKGTVIDIGTTGQLPGNFEKSTTVVAIGAYNGTEFKATRILVKCPSKYERDTAGATQHPGEIPKESPK